MSCHIREEDVAAVHSEGRISKDLITDEQGAVAGFCLGIAVYTAEEYLTPGVHDDQEGFYVVAGEGMAKVGDEEFAIQPGTAFLAPKGVPHCVKRRRGCAPVKLVWTHGAV
jgi:mannose-6-phosphate isomerase-like protein (cupin superfamily)